MNKSIISYVLCGFVGVVLLLAPRALQAQENSLISGGKAQRLHADYNGLQRLLPTHIKLQYAGGMGLASLGMGWDYGRSNQFETDLQVGFIPAKYSSVSRAVFTLKQNWMPWNIRCTDWLGIEPFSCGLYASIISGTTQNYWFLEPSKYGGPYYRFATRVRLHLYVGQRISLYRSATDAVVDRLTLYYELSAGELDLVAKMTNRHLHLDDIVYFSFGVKLGLNL